MDTIRLPQDFKEFLELLNSKEIEYLVVGGHAVAYHGHMRNTLDMDVWVAMSPQNADLLVEALREFGFDVPNLSADLFVTEHKIVQMGVPPHRIDILTTISGVDFEDCYARRVIAKFDEIEVNLLSLDDLKTNKRASGRLKDLDDLEKLS